MRRTHSEEGLLLTSLFQFGPAKRGAAGAVAARAAEAEERELWRSLRAWEQMDDEGFNYVALNHTALSRVLPQQLQAFARGADDADTDAATRKERLGTLLRCVERVVTWLPTDDRAAKRADPVARAQRLGTILPASCLPALALLFARTNPRRATIVLSSWALQTPRSLAALKGRGALWCDEVKDVAAQCTALGRQGRFQRRPADILPVLAQARHLMLSVWAMLHCMPMFADFFCPLKKFMAALRLVAEVVVPLLQHFVMTCDHLATLRVKLTRMTQKLANASVDCAVTALLCASHGTTTGVNAAATARAERLDAAITEDVVAYGGLIPSALLRASGLTFKMLLHSLCDDDCFAVPDEDERYRALRDALPALESTSVGTFEATNRQCLFFAEKVLLGIAAQGVTLTSADAPGLIVTAPVSEQQAPAAVPPPVAPPTAPSRHATDANIQMVRELLPDMPVRAVAAALDYYDGQVERLIDDAYSMNLPPHIAELVEAGDVAPSAAAASASTAPSAAQAPAAVTAPPRSAAEVFDSIWALLGEGSAAAAMDDEEENDFNALREGRGAEDAGSVPVPEGMTLMRTDTGDDWQPMEAALKAKTLELMELVYDDEFDDVGADVTAEVRPLNKKYLAATVDESSDEADDEVLASTEAATAAAPGDESQATRGRGGAGRGGPSNRGRGHSSGGRGAAVAGGRGGQPAYAAKPKALAKPKRRAPKYDRGDV